MSHVNKASNYEMLLLYDLQRSILVAGISGESSSKIY